MCALSFRYFGTMHKEANTNAVLVSGLAGLRAAQPGVLLAAGATEAPLPVPLPLPLPPPAAVAVTPEGECEDDGEGSE